MWATSSSFPKGCVIAQRSRLPDGSREPARVGRLLPASVVSCILPSAKEAKKPPKTTPVTAVGLGRLCCLVRQNNPAFPQARESAVAPAPLQSPRTSVWLRYGDTDSPSLRICCFIASQGRAAAPGDSPGCVWLHLGSGEASFITGPVNEGAEVR